MRNKELPSHLKKCPIIQTSIDITCSFQIPEEAIIGVIYDLLPKENIKLEKLPLANLPEEIRKNDPTLKSHPTHQITVEKGIILLGGYNSLSLGIIPPYKSWEYTSTFIIEIIELLKPTIIKEISSIKLRYVNFFKCNIFEHIDLNIKFENKNITYPSTIFRTAIPSEVGFMSILQITNGVHVENKILGLDDDGSIIDINIDSNIDSSDNIKNIIEKSHKIEKELFFSLMTDEFTNTLIE